MISMYGSFLTFSHICSYSNMTLMLLLRPRRSDHAFNGRLCFYEYAYKLRVSESQAEMIAGLIMTFECSYRDR